MILALRPLLTLNGSFLKKEVIVKRFTGSNMLFTMKSGRRWCLLDPDVTSDYKITSDLRTELAGTSPPTAYPTLSSILKLMGP